MQFFAKLSQAPTSAGLSLALSQFIQPTDPADPADPADPTGIVIFFTFRYLGSSNFVWTLYSNKID